MFIYYLKKKIPTKLWSNFLTRNYVNNLFSVDVGPRGEKMHRSLLCRFLKNHSKAGPSSRSAHICLPVLCDRSLLPLSSCASLPWGDLSGVFLLSFLCFPPRQQTSISVMLCGEQHQNLFQIVLVLSSCCTRMETKGSATGTGASSSSSSSLSPACLLRGAEQPKPL